MNEKQINEVIARRKVLVDADLKERDEFIRVGRVAAEYQRLWGQYQESMSTLSSGDLRRFLQSLVSATKAKLGESCFDRVAGFDPPHWHGQTGFSSVSDSIRFFLDLVADLDAADLSNAKLFAFDCQPIQDLLEAGTSEAFCCRCDRRLWVTQFADGNCDRAQCQTEKVTAREDEIPETIKKQKTNDLMKAELASNMESAEMTAQQWANKIGKSKTSVLGTDTWKSLLLLRETTKAKRALDRSVR